MTVRMQHFIQWTLLVTLSAFCHAAIGQPQNQSGSISITKEIDGEEKEISVERASDEQLRQLKPSVYRAAFAQKVAGKITGPITKFGKFAAVTLPAESVPFYAAMYIHQLSFCDYNSTPNCLEDFWEHLKDPIGHLGFAAFIAVSGTTGRYLQQAMAATERTRLLYKETSARGLGPGVRARARVRARIFGGTQVALNQMTHVLPMTFGMMASSMIEEIAHDQNLTNCAKGIYYNSNYSKTPQALEAIDRVCDEAYDHWVSSRKIWSYGPMLASMLAAQITSQLIQKGISAAAKKMAARQAMKKGAVDLAKKIAINGVMVLLPGGVFVRGVSLGLKVVNLLMFFTLTEEVYNDLLARPFTKVQKGGELKGLVKQFDSRLNSLEKNRWDLAKLYPTSALCDEATRKRLTELRAANPKTLNPFVEKPDNCQSPEVQFLTEARTLSKRWTEWRQFINERFLISFQSWQSKLTDFVGLYDTSFAFYDDFLSAYQRFNESLKSQPDKDHSSPADSEEKTAETTEDGQVSGEEIIRASTLFNPYSTPTIYAPEGWHQGIPQAIASLENYLKKQAPFTKHPELLTQVLFVQANEQPLSENDRIGIMREKSIYIEPKLSDYILIRNYLLASSPDFPLEKFYPEGSYERTKLSEISGSQREVFIKQAKYKLVTHAIKIMDTWLSYEVRTLGVFAGDSSEKVSETDEFKRACNSDEFAKKAGIPENERQLSRCTHVRILSPDHVLVKVRDVLKLPVFLPTGYLGKQSFNAKLNLLQVSEGLVAHEKRLAHADTPGPVEYFFASMACGPESTGEPMKIGGKPISLEQIKSQLADKYLKSLQSISDEEQRQKIVASYKLELFQQTKALIQQMGLKDIQSPFIKDDEGYRLEFKPPRIIKTPKQMSIVGAVTPTQRRLEYDEAQGVCSSSAQRFDVYYQTWKNLESGRDYHGLPELIEDNLHWDLVNKKVKDPIEQEEVMQFYSWWEDQVELPMYAAFHRFDNVFRQLIAEKFLPALKSKGIYGCLNGGSNCSGKNGQVDFSKGEAIPEGIKASILAELQNIFRFTGEAYGSILADQESAGSQDKTAKDQQIKKWMQLRSEIEKQFTTFLGDLEKSAPEDYFDKRNKLEELSKNLKQAVSDMATQMNLKIDWNWKPEWVKDEYTSSLANAIRETGMIQMPENAGPKYMVIRYGVFRMLELEEEMRSFGQMITFMPKEYSSVYKTRDANQKASDEF